MGFADAVRSAFANFSRFEGRARRSEFWWFYLFMMLAAFGGGLIVMVVALLTIVPGSSDGQDPSGIAIGIYLVTIGLWLIGMLVLYIPYLAVWARRLHDMGQTGHWLWLVLAGVGIVPLIMASFDSEAGANRWGPDPKAHLRSAPPSWGEQAPPAGSVPPA
ncbi:DUF805 domain-containing protein [Demequina sp. NBRC 110055]|uniref:DUF805 domain-containing protein n=1 Tax=Demequina sp. NBRC 110055 TaxID=1570344 RepID=UPI0013563A75|nr:DUF805 domain-containing protein [Demequina sp. NBRC 110055]